MPGGRARRWSSSRSSSPLPWSGSAHRSDAWLRAAHRGARSRLPKWLALPATILLGVAFVGLIGSQMVGAGRVAANVIYEALDQGTNPGIDQPTLATVSGNPASLVAWETMGLWGRDFAAGVTSRDQLLAYHGSDAEVRDPIRVFVGMRTADTIEERAAVAVRELERAGGFERSVIAVWVPGGSGWMDPNAALALEQLQAGDTAIVSIQYSYMPSFFSLVIDSSQAIEAGSRSSRRFTSGGRRCPSRTGRGSSSSAPASVPAEPRGRSSARMSLRRWRTSRAGPTGPSSSGVWAGIRSCVS